MSYSGMRVNFPSVKQGPTFSNPPLSCICLVVDGLLESIFLSFMDTHSYIVGLCNSQQTKWAHLDIKTVEKAPEKTCQYEGLDFFSIVTNGHLMRRGL